MQKSTVVVVLLVLGLLFWQGGAQATLQNILKNGSFEVGTNPPTAPRPPKKNPYDAIRTLPKLSNWKVLNGIYWLHGGGLIDTISGARFLFFMPIGVVEQTFATKPGVTYRVRFYMAGNFSKEEYPKEEYLKIIGAGGPGTKQLMVWADGQYQYFNIYKPPYWSWFHPGWKLYTWSFKADDASATLTFASLAANVFLDKVEVIPVPKIKESPKMAPKVDKPQIKLPLQKKPGPDNQYKGPLTPKW